MRNPIEFQRKIMKISGKLWQSKKKIACLHCLTWMISVPEFEGYLDFSRLVAADPCESSKFPVQYQLDCCCCALPQPAKKFSVKFCKKKL